MSPADLQTLADDLATELNVRPQQVARAIELLNDGNTLPFIARYRKEVTAGLDETQLRRIEDALTAAKELSARRETVLKTIDQQGKLTPSLKQQILNCKTKSELEDLYLPFKPKRRTRAEVARERGLQPLADILLAQQRLPEQRSQLLKKYVDAAKDVPSANDALAGACDIVAETWAESADLRKWMTERAGRGRITAAVKRGKKKEGEKFEQWFDHNERVDRIPSHRFLALKRGEAEGILRLNVKLDDDYVLPKLERRLLQNDRFEFAKELRDTVTDCYQRLLQPAAESQQLQQLKQQADAEAITVFARNLRELLLAAPAGRKVTMGIDPGFRTGCKVAVVDETGRFIENTTIFPTAPRNDVDGARDTVTRLLKKHDVQLIAIGNGTASRETDAFVGGLLKDAKLSVTKAVVSEAGASVYSASELAAAEYPDLDVTVRGAISIAHRLQDPLAALVKIDPRSIGVGQYQHDVNQAQLRQALAREVESCVNSVGVDLNSASRALLSYVAGIGDTLADNIVKHRDSNGPFRTRAELKKVARLGNRAFEQAAGFLRIANGKEPLDNSAVHPESYDVVRSIGKRLQVSTAELVGNRDALQQVDVVTLKDLAGEFTLRDILQELAAPGRDPREEFQAVEFREDVSEVSDLQIGMKLDGVVTNVTHFGAFVDIGVHQDGLVHVSQLADHFVSDPTQEVRAGEIISVTVLEIDEARKRISLKREQ